MSNLKSFTVYMYKQETTYLKWLVLQRQNIETGGDLFGLWRSSDTAIVQIIIGPGKRCVRTTTSFFQDINYLDEAGKELTSREGLCHIGGWHSHHRMNLCEPSQGDKTTVWNHMKTVHGGRFLVFIATITGSTTDPEVNINCFMFSTATKTMTRGSLVLLPGCSPIRGQFNDVSIEPGPETDMEWVSFLRNNTLLQEIRNKAKDDEKKENVQDTPHLSISNIATKEPREVDREEGDETTTEDDEKKGNVQDTSNLYISNIATKTAKAVDKNEERKIHREKSDETTTKATKSKTNPQTSYGSTLYKQINDETKDKRRRKKLERKVPSHDVIKTQPQQRSLPIITESTPLLEKNTETDRNEESFGCCGC